MTGVRAIIGACVCAGALAFTAGPALADANHPDYPDSVVSLSIGPPPAGGDFTFTLAASGSNAEVDGFDGPADFDLYLFVSDADVAPTCEIDEAEESLDAEVNPAAVTQIPINGADNFDENVSGSFSVDVPLQVDPTFSGGLVFCAYSLWDDFDDAASASTSITITPSAPAPTPAPPPGTGTIPTPMSPAPGAPGGTLPPTPPQKSLPIKLPKNGKKPKAILPKPNKLTKPKAVFPPQVLRDGQSTLKCFTGTWLQLPTAYQYDWLMPHSRRVLGRHQVLELNGYLRGKQVECSVTVSNEAGRATATSRAYKVT